MLFFAQRVAYVATRRRDFTSGTTGSRFELGIEVFDEWEHMRHRSERMLVRRVQACLPPII
jgi:hypothetical protein